MINLIKNEYVKILHKTSLYVILSIIFIFVLITNILYKYTLNDNGMFYENDVTEEMKWYEETLKDITDVEEKIDYSTDYDILKLVNKYGSDSWQAHYIYNDDFYSIMHLKNECKYYKTECNDDKYNYYIEKFNTNDYMSLLKEEKEEIIKLKETYESIKTSYLDKDEVDKIINDYNNQIEVLDYRINNNISYENNYLNDAINDYLNTLDNTDSKEKEEHIDYLTFKETNKISKYIMDTKQNINKVNDTRGIILNYFCEYEILIILSILLLTGSIISDEYHKGTIKQLLISPHKRYKILLSKIIASLSITFIIFILILILQLIIGGIFFGYSSLSIPQVIYDFNTNKIVTYNVFVYLLILFINKLPLFIIFTMMSLCINSIFNNNAITIITCLLIYILSSVISALALNLDFINYFISLHWDLSIYLFGRIQLNEFLTMPTSIITCILYLIIFTAVTFILFIKKDIKNV